MNHIYSRIVTELTDGHDLCLATIVDQSGSAPRELGTRFLVKPDGGIIGTIGGGRLEADVIDAALSALSERVYRLISFTLAGMDVAETEMLCGGNVSVYLEPLYAGDQAAIDLFVAAAGEPAPNTLMVTPIQPGPAAGIHGRKLLLRAGQSPVGAVTAAPELSAMPARQLADLLGDNRPRRWVHPLADGERLDCFLEPVVPEPVVYLFGGGHISLALATLVKMVGFRLVVVDDREEFASKARFPQADQVRADDYDGIIDRLDPGKNAYIVIVTRGHQHDRTVLSQALAKGLCYVGMIGSRRKRGLIYRSLIDDGVDPAELDRVHSPIGLNIGAQTPEEIAVSIVAELIAVRAGQRDSSPT